VARLRAARLTGSALDSALNAGAVPSVASVMVLDFPATALAPSREMIACADALDTRGEAGPRAPTMDVAVTAQEVRCMVVCPAASRARHLSLSRCQASAFA